MTDDKAASAPVQAEQSADAEILSDARKALNAGFMSPDVVQRHYGLSEDELSSLQSPAPSQRTIAQELRDLAALRTTDPKRYNSDETQARHLHLIEMQQKQQAERGAVPAETGDRLAAIDKELREIDGVRRNDNRAYRRDEAMQKREIALLAEREALANGTGNLPKAVLDEWERTDGVGPNLERARGTAQVALDELGEAEGASLVQGFDSLPEGAQAAAFRFLAIAPGRAAPASEDAVQAFGSTEEGASLIQEWGRQAATNIGTVRTRIELIASSMNEADRAAATAWFENLSPTQAAAVMRALAR